MLDKTGSVVLVGMLADTAAKPWCRFCRVIVKFMSSPLRCTLFGVLFTIKSLQTVYFLSLFKKKLVVVVYVEVWKKGNCWIGTVFQGDILPRLPDC
jgi:hypothetical protein